MFAKIIFVKETNPCVRVSYLLVDQLRVLNETFDLVKFKPQNLHDFNKENTYVASVCSQECDFTKIYAKHKHVEKRSPVFIDGLGYSIDSLVNGKRTQFLNRKYSNKNELPDLDRMETVSSENDLHLEYSQCEDVSDGTVLSSEMSGDEEVTAPPPKLKKKKKNSRRIDSDEETMAVLKLPSNRKKFRKCVKENSHDLDAEIINEYNVNEILKSVYDDESETATDHNENEAQTKDLENPDDTVLIENDENLDLSVAAGHNGSNRSSPHCTDAMFENGSAAAATDSEQQSLSFVPESPSARAAAVAAGLGSVQQTEFEKSISTPTAAPAVASGSDPVQQLLSPSASSPTVAVSKPMSPPTAAPAVASGSYPVQQLPPPPAAMPAVAVAKPMSPPTTAPAVASGTNPEQQLPPPPAAMPAVAAALQPRAVNPLNLRSNENVNHVQFDNNGNEHFRNYFPHPPNRAAKTYVPRSLIGAKIGERISTDDRRIYLGLNVCVDPDLWLLLARRKNFDHSLFIRRIAKIIWNKREILKGCKDIKRVRDPENREVYNAEKFRALEELVRHYGSIRSQSKTVIRNCVQDIPRRLGSLRNDIKDEIHMEDDDYMESVYYL